MSDFETVKERADIVDVVSQYATLQRAGRYFKACCPFHNEKTPSFYVYPDQQSWHCFGACGTGGDVFTFIEKKENLSPVEALKVLADRYGVTLERRGRTDEPATGRLIEANEAAARYFHHLLLNAPAAEAARAYAGKRALDPETVRAFELGYSPAGWDGLREHLRGRGFSAEEQAEAGLLSRGDKGMYDRFRDRLMFPIRDERGRVIGFGGRVLGDGVPKYLNSPQTALFDKGATLYALDRAKEGIRAAESAVVVEGYMDAITAHQHGITNVVATLGTALTERHLALLKRYTRQVVLAMDADAAGIEAALRGEELVRKAAAANGDGPAQVVIDWRNLVRVQAAAPVEVRVFTVPHGKDPDEAIRADPEAFRELARRAVPPFEFRLRHELAAIDRDDPRARRGLAERLLPLVAAIADRALQAQYLARLAQATAIPEDVLATEMAASTTRGGRLPMRERANHRNAERGTSKTPRLPEPRPGRNAEEEGTDVRPAAETPTVSPSTDAAPPADASPVPRSAPASTGSPTLRVPGSTGRGVRLETTALRLVLTYDNLQHAGLALDEALFTDPANRSLLKTWKAWPPPALEEMLDEPGREHLTRVLAERMPPYDDATAARAFEDVVARLQLHRLEDRARLMAASVKETGGADAVAERALAALTGEPSHDPTADEAVTQWLKGVELSQDRHALEAGLRTRGVSGPGAAPPPARQ